MGKLWRKQVDKTNGIERKRKIGYITTENGEKRQVPQSKKKYCEKKKKRLPLWAGPYQTGMKKFGTYDQQRTRKVQSYAA